MKHFAKKSLGQNFLKNPAVVDKIVEAAEIKKTDTILEIGPGQGALTIALLEKAGRVIAIEKDDNLFAQLQETFVGDIQKGKLELFHGDVMEFATERSAQTNQDLQRREDPARSGSAASESPGSFARGFEDYKLVANIPYNITGAIIEKFLSANHQPTMMVLLVQKEVAERIVAKNTKSGKAGAKPGKESILSIAVKAYGIPSYITTVKAGNFVPAPKVDSAVIKIDNISRDSFKNLHHEQVFFQVMKAGFAHKRKTLAGNLKNILEPELVMGAMRAATLPETTRAEDVPITTWRSLADFVYNTLYGTVSSD